MAIKWFFSKKFLGRPCQLCKRTYIHIDFRDIIEDPKLRNKSNKGCECNHSI